MHKGALTALILAGLLGSPKAAEILFWTFLRGKYKTSAMPRYRKRLLGRYPEWDEQLKIEWERYRGLVTHLKRDNLIQIEDGVLHLTHAGRSRLGCVQKTLKGRLPQAHYVSEPADRWLLVAFDVPEKERHKREWLRERLREMEFVLLQKSLWGARRKLPKQFLEDLRRFAVIGYVDIFSISKQGTLRRMA